MLNPLQRTWRVCCLRNTDKLKRLGGLLTAQNDCPVDGLLRVTTGGARQRQGGGHHVIVGPGGVPVGDTDTRLASGAENTEGRVVRNLRVRR